MIVTIISWSAMMLIFIIIGIALSTVVYRLFRYTVSSIHGVTMIGVVGTTVYAESFSLFYKLGAVSFVCLFVICLSLVAVCKKSIGQRLSAWKQEFQSMKKSTKILIFLTFFIIVLVGAFFSSSLSIDGDSYLYHIPSIRWLEEFGVVKGLGNLHNRIAFNSSFLCLQALFSFSWISQISMHSLNGLIWTFMILFCVCDLWFVNSRPFQFVDELSLLFLILLIHRTNLIASPNTDFLPFCIVGYILINWWKQSKADLTVANENENILAPYFLLSILGVFSVTVKLSSCALLVLSTYPAYKLIRKHDHVTIGKSLLIGLIVLCPFLIRNFILSGYLVYPVASIDVFNVDWKIPKSVTVSDSSIIKAFARMNGVSYYYQNLAWPLPKWIKEWLNTSIDCYKYIEIINLIVAPLTIVLFLCQAFRKKVERELFFAFSCSCGVLFIVFTAPSMRFGEIWFVYLPLTVGYLFIISIRRLVTNEGSKKLKKGLSILYCVLALIPLYYVGYECRNRTLRDMQSLGSVMIMPADYELNGADGQYTNIGGYKFYYAVPNMAGRNNTNGYDGFPGSAYLESLCRVEMRGESLKDGFRVKEEFQDIPFDYQGSVLEPSLIRVLGLDDYYDVERMEKYVDATYHNTMLSDELTIDLTGFSTVEGSLVYEIDYDNKGLDNYHWLSGWKYNDKEIHTISGWAYISKEGLQNSDTFICLKYGDKYYMCDTIKRKDVAQEQKLDTEYIGFVAYLLETDTGEVCIIDPTNKIIYK